MRFISSKGKSMDGEVVDLEECEWDQFLYSLEATGRRVYFRDFLENRQIGALRENKDDFVFICKD